MRASFYKRGYYAELKLCELLQERGWWACRIPRSGKYVVGDIVAIKDGKILLFEIKRRSKEGTIYIDRENYEEMIMAELRTGGTFWLALYAPERETGIRKWKFRRVRDADFVTEKHAIYRVRGLNAKKWCDLDTVLR